MTPAIIFRTEETKERAVQRIRAIKPDPDRPLAIWIGPYQKIRTLAQNAKYWKLVGLCVAATGNSKAAFHEYFKRCAFGVLVEQIADKTQEYVPSSSKASRGDFSELIEYVQEFVVEHGIEEQV